MKFCMDVTVNSDSVAEYTWPLSLTLDGGPEALHEQEDGLFVCALHVLQREGGGGEHSLYSWGGREGRGGGIIVAYSYTYRQPETLAKHLVQSMSVD